MSPFLNGWNILLLKIGPSHNCVFSSFLFQNQQHMYAVENIVTSHFLKIQSTRVSFEKFPFLLGSGQKPTHCKYPDQPLSCFFAIHGSLDLEKIEEVHARRTLRVVRRVGIALLKGWRPPSPKDAFAQFLRYFDLPLMYIQTLRKATTLRTDL